MISSKAFTTIVIGAPGVDPRVLQMGTPALLSEDTLVSMIHKAIPPFADDFTTPGLAYSDGSSQSSDSPPCSSESYGSISSFPQYGHSDYGTPFSPATSASSLSPRLPSTRVLVEAPCAGGRAIKQKAGGYRCSNCDDLFKRQDDAKRHIGSAGKRVECKYCGKPASGRRDGQRRHLRENKNCLKRWDAGYKAGRFAVRSVEDAYNN